MARPSDQSIKVIKEISAAVLECSASQTIIGSLINCKDVMEKVVSQTGVARPELDINLNPGDPSH